MSIRDRLLQNQREYRQALEAAEKRFPAGTFYAITPDNGAQEDGRMLYYPKDDTLAIEIGSFKGKLQGKHLNSICRSLSHLLSEAE